jgi:uncharacterized membrane protein
MFKLVFSNSNYAVLAAAIFSVMFVALSFLSEYLFFEPYLVFYVPDDRMISFVTLLAVSVLSAIVLPMNLYRILMLQKMARKIGGSFLASFIGASAGACSCGPVGFAVISTFGTAGGIATSFLSAYELPLRIFSIVILGGVLYATVRSLRSECRVR